jgi:hypothetical protein
MAQGFLQQESAKVGNRAALLLGTVEECLMDVVTERDRDTSRLALQHM